MAKKPTPILLGAIFISALFTVSGLAKGKTFSGLLTPLKYFQLPQDSTDKDKGSELPYPLKDRQGDFVTDQNENPFMLEDPSVVEKKVEYDPETNMYVITETVNGRNIRPPTYMTFEEYLAYERKQSEKEYWDERAKAITLVERRGIIPKLYVGKNLFDRLFGGTTVDIRPSGNIDLTFGGNVQKIDNPNIPESARKQGGFDFDMNINMNVVGKIGEKVKINMSYNTEATFDFENQIKLNYEGEEDDIIKKIEAGNVSFSLPTSLINGSQSLFGLYTKLQFGRLTLTNVYSQQKSKAETLTIENGAQTQTFELYADQYDENRHYFLSQYFRDNYNYALANLPNINSQVQVNRVEVWVTNKERVTENTRYVVGFMDLGETDSIYRDDVIMAIAGRRYPDNGANNLYSRLTAREQDTRSPDEVITTLESDFNLKQVQDFEKVYARRLNPSEYTFQPQLGYISLNQRLDPDEVLAVAYEYTVNNSTYQVGEFSQNLTPSLTVDTTQVDTLQRDDRILFVKMLKSTAVRPTLPIWNLMMKNIYPLGAFQVNAEDFKLNIMYQDPGGGEKRYLPEGKLVGVPLIRVLELDNLNNQRDPQPDGIFDFVPGITINPSNGRVIFPVLEPFGNDLRRKLTDAGDAQLASKYVYDQLYDSTKTIAQQFPQYNRFVLKGSYKSSVSNEISLGAFNVPQGSVTVTAGGQKLVEGRDYTIDYSLGRVKILNEGILNSGVPINVSYENNALFGFQTKTLFGMRADYWINDNFSLGATYMHLRERPFTEKVNIGDDPISNSIVGFDFKYNTESKFLTWLVDKLPFYETKEPSSFTLTGEMARLKPGHQKAIGKDGTVYIDDFEGTRSSYDLKFPATSWYLASTPLDSRDRTGSILFPEAEFRDSLVYGYNRAKLAWYTLDPYLLRENAPDYSDPDEKKNHYVREIDQQEVFPNKSVDPGILSNILTFDMAYYPQERGPYNYEHSATAGNYSAGVNADGTLKDPASRWGGIMRSIDNNDFEAANIEYIEFWVLDPFMDNENSTGGEMYIDLGNVSEDILKDSRYFFENGIPRVTSNVRVDTTKWGIVPTTQPITNSFDNDESLRALQDVGLDGLATDYERVFFDSIINGPNGLASFLNPSALQTFTNDPSSDNYHYYLGDDYNAAKVGILGRYKKYNGPDGNSPSSGSNAGTNIPDSEDLNRDNNMNESEQYFQYRIKLEPNMNVGENFITDKLVAPAPNGTSDATWYQFKIPISDYESQVNGISDFKSIRFMRMFLTNFSDSVVLRFATLELVRNQWRRYLFDLKQPGENVLTDDLNRTFFNVSAVNVEENSAKSPIPYALPPDISREESLSSTNTTTYQNEQSLAVQVCDLPDGDARAVYKTLNLDLRQYGRLKMFIHGESLDPDNPLNDGDVEVFLRLGSDFTGNYYEYSFPLKITPATGNYKPENDADRQAIWPSENYIDIDLDSFIVVKQLRNNDPASNVSSEYFVKHGNATFSIVGNPDLGLVKTAMLGIRNPKGEKKPGETIADDREPKCVEVWFNEFRLTGLNEKGGWAALARMETQLADLGSIVFSTNMHTKGYGQIEQKVDQRYKDDFVQYDGALSIDLGKFLPKKVGFRIPMYASIAQSFSTPEYDPYELDVPLKDKLSFLEGSNRKDYKRQVQNLETIKSINFTNVRLVSQKKDKKPRFWDPSNLNFTFAYTNTKRSDPFIESDLIEKYKASLGYNYSPQAKYLYPFKKAIKAKTKYLDIVRDLNFNFIPNNLSFSTDMNRQFGKTQLRTLGEDEFPIEPTYDKYFTWDRFYGIKYNPAQSITFDFTAVNNARIDEPQGDLGGFGSHGKDSLWSSIFAWGRTTNYSHTTNANYNVPINKIPILDWVTARAGYSANYNWATGGFTRKAITDENGYYKVTSELIKNPLGNIITNSQAIRLNGELNLKKLYDDFKGLKPYNSTSGARQTSEELKKKIKENEKRSEKIDKDIQKMKEDIGKLKDDIKKVKHDEKVENKKEEVKKLKKQIKVKREGIKKLRKDRGRIIPPERPAASPFVRPFISIKRISVNWTQTKNTALPGYLPGTKLLGSSNRDEADYNSPDYNKPGFQQPGWKFIFGYQPDQAWLDEAARKGWITPDTTLNVPYMQSVSRNLDIKGVVEPFKDFRVDLTLTKTEAENYTEFFKRQSGDRDYWEHLSPKTTGSYTISFISVKTLFQKTDEQGLTAAYHQFSENRKVISQRLGDANPNSNGIFKIPDDTEKGLSDYRQGYGPYSQDVLMPAFIAAYTGKNAKDVKLNPFKTVPLPNWRITYTGLSKMKFLQKVVTNVTISHAYNSTLSINGFETQFNYKGSYLGTDVHGDSLYNNDYFQPSVIDTLTGNFYSKYAVPQIVMSERFSPLIGVDITWAKNVTTKFDYSKTRNLSMSFVDYQLSESKSTEITFGLGYRLKGLTIPIKIRGKKRRLENDLNFRFEFSYRNNVTTNQRLDEDIAEPTRGMKTYTISPSIDYVINSRLNVKLFFDRTKSIPATSASYPITNTKAGITLRFSLTQ